MLLDVRGRARHAAGNTPAAIQDLRRAGKSTPRDHASHDDQTIAVSAAAPVPKVVFNRGKYKASLQSYCHALTGDLGRFIAAQYRAAP